MRAAILDLQIGRGVNAVASYVAMTRLRTREDLLIYRNFDRDVFMQGEPEGPSLLLRKLRGEKIDWAAIEEKHTPKRLCKGPCMSLRLKDDFYKKEWENTTDPHCKVCIKKLREQGKTVRCTKCREWYGDEALTDTMKQHWNTHKFVCDTCKELSLIHI